MLVSLVHGSMDWIMAGFIICLGLIVFLSKLVKGEIISFIIGGIICFRLQSPWWRKHGQHHECYIRCPYCLI